MCPTTRSSTNHAEAARDPSNGADEILSLLLDRYAAIAENAHSGGQVVARITARQLRKVLATSNATERAILSTGLRLTRGARRALLTDIARELGIEAATVRQSVGRLAKRAGIRRQKPARHRIHRAERAALSESGPQIDPDEFEDAEGSDEQSSRNGPWTAFRADEVERCSPQRRVPIEAYLARKSCGAMGEPQERDS